ncbi:restriction endonuclease [Lentzea alba]|uniref:hypothetical protein n=1 Tax=Lentzea alba TaxID=2714351 RepID=UPI0039BFD566
MVAVRWEDFDENPAGYERLAKLLILREFPGAVAIDGRGGDGGVDLRWDSPDGLVIFECKKYTKIANTQRRHIKRSLGNAANHQPARWILVVPTDPTPTQHEWFTSQLAADAPFTIEWLGRNWLDERIAAHPDIRRSVLDGAQIEVFKAVAEARAEADFLIGASDFASRAMTLHSRANELSPSWNIRWDATKNEVIASPKPGAPPEDVRINFELDFPSDDQGAQATRRQYEDVVAVGGTITIPPQYVTSISNAGLEALGLLAGPGELTIATPPETDGLPIPVTFRTTGGGQQPTRPLQVILSRRERGLEGITLHGRDVTGLLTVQLVLRQRPGCEPTFSASLVASDGTSPELPLSAVDPAALLRLNELLAGIDVGRTMEISFPDGRAYAPLTAPADPMFARLRDLLEDLVTVRDSLGLNLPIPQRWRRSDERNIRFAAQILRGESAALPGRTQPTFHQSAEQHLHLLNIVPTTRVNMRIQGESVQLTFNDVNFEIGPLTIQFSSLDLQNPEACKEAALAEREVKCVFHPRAESTTIASLEPVTASNESAGHG